MQRPHLRRSTPFAATLLLALLLLPAGALAQSTVSGVYSGNGKPAKLTQVTAHKGEPQSGQPVTVLVFSSKDQGGDPKADFNALFGKFGDAVVVRIFADGKVYSGDLVHAALDTPGGSAQVFGILKIEDFKAAGGEISGHLTSGGERELHGDQKWEVNLTFTAKAP
jgi:hypothetical protein